MRLYEPFEKILLRIIDQGHFLTATDVKELLDLPEPLNDALRLRPVLVRCGCGRFTCPLQDVSHFVGLIDSSDSDHVRDVSLPVHLTGGDPWLEMTNLILGLEINTK